MTDLPPMQTFEEFEAAVAPMLTPKFVSRFGAVRLAEIFEPGPQHEWLIKGFLTRGELSMLAGPSQSGKSFLAIDLAFAIARGVDWFGKRVRRGGVIYQAGESSKGVRRKRIPAYLQHHGVSRAELDAIPFTLLTRPLDLYGSDDPTDAFIAECRALSAEFDCPLELIVVDTFSAATPGANENASEDVSRVLARCQRISEATGAGVLLVHHMNAEGAKPRGHTSILANLDSVILCRKEPDKHDADSRQIREMSLAKSKDGDADGKWRFVLPSVAIGRDADGDDVTSCVVALPRQDNLVKAEEKGFRTNQGEAEFLAALAEAVDKFGMAPPSDLRLPGAVRLVAQIEDVKKVFKDRYAATEGDDDETKIEARLRQRWSRATKQLLRFQIIASSKPFIWMTGRPVRGFKLVGVSAPEERRAPPPPTPIHDDDVPEGWDF